MCLIALAAMLSGVAWLSAQDVPVEIEETPDAPQSVTAWSFSNGPAVFMGNCSGSFLGIVGDEVKKETVQELGLPGEYGALINEVVTESGAEKAGLQKNDVIVGFNDARVESMAQLRRLIAETPVGRTVDLRIVRNGAEQVVPAELGTRPMPQMNTMLFQNGENMYELPEGVQWNSEEFEEMMKENMEKMEEQLKELNVDVSELRRVGPDGFDGSVWFGPQNGEDGEPHALYFHMPQLPKMDCKNFTQGRPRLGVTVQSLSSQLAEYFKLEEGTTGALISEIHEGTPAERDGLKSGDVILAVDGEQIKEVGQLPQIISKKEGVIKVDVVRDGQKQSYWIDLGSKADGVQDQEKNMQEEIFTSPEMEPGLSFNGR